MQLKITWLLIPWLTISCAESAAPDDSSHVSPAGRAGSSTGNNAGSSTGGAGGSSGDDSGCEPSARNLGDVQGKACYVEEATCQVGEECCCGQCSASLNCNCSDGRWSCYYTDFCFRRDTCGDAGGQGGHGGQG